ncbi:MAG: thiamine phosphate synthase [Zetaproteobacteria bacterium]|nr:MAG: thiamine phosphate synthase [Zetaproteobacteria bacterium]
MEAMAAAALAGGVRWLQLRDKKQGFRRACRRAKRLAALCADHDARLIVNDSIAVAAEAGACGVHLGRDELPGWQEIDRAHEQGLIVGVTCRGNAQWAQAAAAGGADYLSFGAIFPTHSKPEVPTIGIARLAKARRLFPDAVIVAIGGIDADNIVQIKQAGADAAALISGIFAAGSITERARLLDTLWRAA